jgi:flagellar motor switch protein FliN/FliY
MAEEMSPEDFGLGDDNDIGGDKAGAPAGADPSKLPRTDFSKLKMILDVPLKVSVELGRTKMLINDLLQLGQGSVIELDKIAGEPMEILINDKLVAMGEVVVVNEKFGVRLTDVVSQFGFGDLATEKTL